MPSLGNVKVQEGYLPGDAQLGKVGGSTSLLEVVLSLDTAAYASGDVLADTQIIQNAMRVNGGTGILQSMTIVDESAQGVALTVLIFRENVSLGVENAAASIIDANARSFLASVPVATTDYVDLVASKVANLKNIGAVVQSLPNSKDLYVAVLNSTGTPTYSASGMRLVFGFLQD